jgi:hypothetical protein
LVCEIENVPAHPRTPPEDADKTDCGKSEQENNDQRENH